MLLGTSQGVYLVQERSHWDDILQMLHARVTFELFTPLGTRREIVTFNAVDVLDLAGQILQWANSAGAASSVPLMNGFTAAQQTYTATHTGPVDVTPNLADQSDVGAVVPPFVLLT